MINVPFVHNDGGRLAAGFKGSAGDCGVRAAAIVSRRSYREVYDELFAMQCEYISRKRKLKNKKASPRNGVYRDVLHDYMTANGATYIAFAGIGKPPIRVFQVAAHYSQRRLILRLARHYSTLIDGCNHDTWYQHPEKRVYSIWIMPDA